MANSPRYAGREARRQSGWIRSQRFLLARRLVQLTVLGLFLSGPLLGVWILRGNYSSSLLLETVPLTDPLMLLESLAAGHWPQWLAVLGGGIVAVAYALLGSRLFCGWVCPMNPVTDLAAWLRRQWGIRQSATLSRALRYGVLLAVLVGSALTGTLLWEWVNPVAILGRGLISGFGHMTPLEGIVRGVIAGFGAGIWLILAIFLFDLLVVEHGWCGHLCPMGALYGVLCARGIFRVSATHRERCTRCMDCLHVCPEPQVLREPLFGKQTLPLVLDKDCISCGRCLEVCAENVLDIKTRFHRSGAKS